MVVTCSAIKFLHSISQWLLFHISLCESSCYTFLGQPLWLRHTTYLLVNDKSLELKHNQSSLNHFINLETYAKVKKITC